MWELFFIKAEMKVNGQYCCDILLSQRMFDVIKRVVDDNFVFQQGSAVAHIAFNIV